ncbi:MAG: DUF6599 family protein [Candidatus Acidiferrales bacterium]
MNRYFIRVRSFVLALAALLMLTAFPAWGQSLLPSSFAGWNQTGNAPSAAPPGLQNSAIFEEYGLAGAETQTYARDGKSVAITLRKFKDPSGAYGAYSYLRTPDMPAAHIGAHSSVSANRALLLVGTLVVDINGKDIEKSTPDWRALFSLLTPRAESGPLPTLWEHLPGGDMIERSDHYILGPAALAQFFPISRSDWLGFSQGAEAETAQYRIHGHDLTLLIADFPTPQLAQKQLDQMQWKLGVISVNNPSGGIAPGSSPLYAKRALTMLAIVSNAQSQDEAQALLNQVQSGTVFTWDEPTWQFKEPGIGPMLVGTIYGTGIICAFTLVAGIAFGGFRLLVKRTLPDRVFDRSDQMQILQLGLSSKPINAEDFYGLGNGSRSKKPRA